MNKKYLKILCDPKTGEDLKLSVEKEINDEIIEGYLVSTTNKYRILNGIPRFVFNEGYSDNFGWQWNKWAKIQFENQNIGKPMEGHTSKMFYTITQFNNEDLRGKTVLDIGCGSGRFMDLLSEIDVDVIGIDYSNAIDVAKANLNGKNSLFIQGDALQLPFKPNSIDYAYSIGVLHHTPAPQKGVQEAFNVLKKDGVFAISVYSKESSYNFLSVHIWRVIFKFFWPIFKHYPPLIYSRIFGTLNHFLGKINRYLTYPIKLFFPTIVLKDLKWSILDTFDSITTSYQSGHTIYEVFNWFKISGFKEIEPGNWRVNLIGKK